MKEKNGFAAKCTAPEVMVDSQDGGVLRLCSNSNISEWKSLALLGKVALNDSANKYQSAYGQMYNTEADIGLKLYSEVKKGE